MLEQSNKEQRKVGIKQCIKVVEEDKAKMVFVAKDAEKHVVNKLIELCKQKDIEITFIDTMKQLGKMCNIDVEAASAVIIKDN